MPFDNSALTLFADRKFLLIEDFDVMRSILRTLLLRCGARHIDTAASAREADMHLQRNKYDVVLCDYNLGPGKNGQIILEEARHNKLIGPAAIWIMITAEKTSDMVSAVAEHSPDDYLIKPITEAALTNRLTRLVTRKDMLADIAAAMRARHYLRALDLCAQRLAQDKGNPLEVLRLQADLYLLIDKPEQARSIYDAILARRAVPWAKLGMAKLSFHDKDYPRARSLLDDVIADHPQYIEAYDWLARVHRIKGASEDEEHVLARAATVSPNSASRQGALGDAALRCGHTDVAEAAYRRSIRLGEHSTLKSPTPYLGLARVYSTLDRPKEALQVLGELGQRFDTADVQIRAKAEEVRVLHRSGDTEGAAALARTLSERMQGDGPDLGAAATLELAETFMLTGQRDEASQLLQFVMRNNDDNNEIATQARAVFDQGGMGEEGQALLDQSRQQAREAMQEGVRQLSEGKLGDALDQMRAARAAMPHNPRALLNLAYVLIVTLEKQGWRHDFDDEARKSVLAAQHLAPGEPRATQLLVRLEKAGSSRLAAPRA